MDTFGEQPEEKIREIYEGIKLPKRATTGSAGYDFFPPVSFTLAPGETVKIPTGVRVEMAEDWVLVPVSEKRSGIQIPPAVK